MGNIGNFCHDECHDSNFFGLAKQHKVNFQFVRIAIGRITSLCLYGYHVLSSLIHMFEFDSLYFPVHFTFGATSEVPNMKWRGKCVACTIDRLVSLDHWWLSTWEMDRMFLPSEATHMLVELMWWEIDTHAPAPLHVTAAVYLTLHNQQLLVYVSEQIRFMLPWWRSAWPILL